MKVLITGAGGFVGGHLMTYLRTHTEATVIGTTYGPRSSYPHLPDDVQTTQVDLTDTDRLHAILAEHKPDHIYHLAAQTFVPESFDHPWETLRTNIKAQLNLLESVRRLDLGTRILVLGSGEEYGHISPDDVPVSEQQPLRPTNPYSVSKVTQDMLGLQYFLSYGVATIRVRPFNHIGPGQKAHFVAPAFASQIAVIERGETEPVMYVGNLEARRDFTDVRDIVRAYALLMERGEPGAVYNVGTGNAHSVRDLLETLLAQSQVEIEVRVDESRLRPVETPVIACDSSKLRATTGWQPEIAFEQSLADILTEWRTKEPPT